MPIDGFEAAVVILFLLAPGALFLSESARYYSPAMRNEYLRHQFPLELTIYYLLASILIHGILFFFAGAIIFVSSEKTKNPSLIVELLEVLSQFPRVTTQNFFLILVLGITYLFFSFLMAYLGAKRLRQYILLPEPLWCNEIIKVLAGGGAIDVVVEGQDGDFLSGQLDDFRFISEEKKSFEMLLSVRQAEQPLNSIIWVSSEIISAMDMQSSTGVWRFIFSQVPEKK